MKQHASQIAVAARESRTSLGFWLYLMTDCLLFASLFATYVVLRDSTAGGPAGREIFDLPIVLIETILLLISSFTTGLAMIALRLKSLKYVLIFLAITYVLGVAFLTIEVNEFTTLVADGHSWQQSAFLSAFFTLVGTHGLHITVGLLWLLVLVVTMIRRGITVKIRRQLLLFAMFWHFLDVIWIFIFTVVYLTGVV